MVEYLVPYDITILLNYICLNLDLLGQPVRRRESIYFYIPIFEVCFNFCFFLFPQAMYFPWVLFFFFFILGAE